MKKYLTRVVALLIMLVGNQNLLCQLDSLQTVAPSLLDSSCVTAIIHEGDSGIFLRTQCESKIRYYLSTSIDQDNEIRGLYITTWAYESTIHYFQRKSEKQSHLLAEKDSVNILLREDKSMLIGQNKSLSDGYKKIEAQNKGLKTGVVVLIITTILGIAL